MPLNPLYTVNSEEVEKVYSRYIHEANWLMQMQMNSLNLDATISRHNEEARAHSSGGIVIDGEVGND